MFAVAVPLFAAPAAAAPTAVTLVGNVLNSCVLSISTGGVLVADSTGTNLRSDAGSGARGASLSIVALGLAPTLTFAAPTLTAPSGFAADTVQFSYNVSGTGQSRGFAATSATATARLLDAVQINGLVTSATGFPAGTYTETVQVTCGQ